MAGGIFSWLLDFEFHDLRLPVINLWFCRIIYTINCIAAALILLIGPVVILNIAAAAPEDARSVAFLSGFIIIIILWIVIPLLLVSVRLILEWYILIFDWIVETTKAARLIIKEYDTQQK